MGMDSANERRCYIVTSFLIGRAHTQNDPWIILGMGSANERRWCIVTSSLIGRAHTQNDPLGSGETTWISTDK